MQLEFDVPFSAANPQAIARNLVTALERLAERLERATDAPGFVSALEANGAVWRKLGRFALNHDYPIPPRAEDFAQSLELRARLGVGDDQVQAMIDLNRSTASHISQSLLKADHYQVVAA